MRKHLALATAAALVLAATAIAPAAPPTNSESKLKARISPSKLPKKRFRNASLFVETSTVNPNDPGTPRNPATRPEPTTHVVIDFDDDGTVRPGAVATCKVSDAAFQSFTGTIAQARRMCGRKSVLGTGDATVCLAGATGAACGGVNPPERADVIAFNGQPKAGKPTVYLYAKGTGDISMIGQEITGTIKRSPLGRDYGKRLDVPVPPLGGGIGALTDFRVTVSKGSYIRARCHDRNHRLNARARFTYNDGTSEVVRSKQRCRIA